MQSQRLIVRHALVSFSFVLVHLLLNRPEVILLSRIGFVAWYPAIGLARALMLGVSPWYALLACFSVPLASRVIYGQPVTSFSNTVDAVGIAICYGAAAYVLRGALQIDLGLRRRRDVVRYVLVSATAAAGATIIGVACLIADHSITWGEYKPSALGWFLGDAIGLVGIAPFLLVHVFPHVRNWLSPSPSQFHPARAHSSGTKFTFGEIPWVLLDAQATCVFSCSASKRSPLFQSVKVMAAILRASVRRAISGFMPLASKAA
jgi:integral membrane sensor domain MASE1